MNPPTLKYAAPTHTTDSVMPPGLARTILGFPGQDAKPTAAQVNKAFKDKVQGLDSNADRLKIVELTMARDILRGHLIQESAGDPSEGGG